MGPRTEHGNQNMMETLINRFESSEFSEKEIPIGLSEMEHQTASQMYSITGQKLEGEAFDLVNNEMLLNKKWRRSVPALLQQA